MCRSIKVLRTPSGPAGVSAQREAALQYIRKVSGFRSPSERNRAAFEEAVEAVAEATAKLLSSLPDVRSRAKSAD